MRMAAPGASDEGGDAGVPARRVKAPLPATRARPPARRSKALRSPASLPKKVNPKKRNPRITPARPAPTRVRTANVGLAAVDVAVDAAGAARWRMASPGRFPTNSDRHRLRK